MPINHSDPMDDRPKLSAKPRGANDIYWCYAMSQPTLAFRNTHMNDIGCGLCGTLNIDNSPRHAFLASVTRRPVPENEMLALADAVIGTDDAEAEIKVLRDAIDQFSQQVHQAYHGAQPPDLSDVTHRECSRGLCRSAQHVLSPNRPKGRP